MNSILLISAPGAGKGMTSKYLKNKYNMEHMAIGNLIREKIENNAILSKQVKDGNFIDNKIVYSLFEQFIDENKNKNFVFDGFPRLISQIDKFEEIISNNGIIVDKVIFITIDNEIAIKRITGRLICENCNEIYNKFSLQTDKCEKCNSKLIPRNDDKLQTYENRYNLFIENTLPVVEYYKDKFKEKFYEISNNGSITELYEKIDKIMEDEVV